MRVEQKQKHNRRRKQCLFDYWKEDGDRLSLNSLVEGNPTDIISMLGCIDFLPLQLLKENSVSASLVSLLLPSTLLMRVRRHSNKDQTREEWGEEKSKPSCLGERQCEERGARTAMGGGKEMGGPGVSCFLGYLNRLTCTRDPIMKSPPPSTSGLQHPVIFPRNNPSY